MLQGALLYEYLFQFHQLPLPGLGTFVLKKNPASLSVVDKRVNSGGYLLEFSAEQKSDTHLLSWIALREKSTVELAREMLKKYISAVIDQLSTKGNFSWGSMGFFEKNAAGDFHFKYTSAHPLAFQEVVAEKVFRGSATHEVLVGDRVYSGDAIQKVITDHKAIKQYHWQRVSLAALTLAVVIICIIAFANPDFVFKHQLHFKMKAKSHGETYIMLPK